MKHMRRCILPCAAFLAGQNCPCTEAADSFRKWMADTIGTNDMACVLALIRESRRTLETWSGINHPGGDAGAKALSDLYESLKPFANAKTPNA